MGTHEESITIQFIELHHTKSTELFLFFIQSGEDDWIKATLPMNGCFLFVVASPRKCSRKYDSSGVSPAKTG